jgi:hypothetical protein
MFSLLLHKAGFFSIKWDASTADQVEGTTYVRPTPHEVLRVFVSADGGQVEVYAGSLFAGKLCYRGAVHTEAELLRLVSGNSAYVAA